MREWVVKQASKQDEEVKHVGGIAAAMGEIMDANDDIKRELNSDRNKLCIQKVQHLYVCKFNLSVLLCAYDHFFLHWKGKLSSYASCL